MPNINGRPNSYPFGNYEKQLLPETLSLVKLVLFNTTNSFAFSNDDFIRQDLCIIMYSFLLMPEA